MHQAKQTVDVIDWQTQSLYGDKFHVKRPELDIPVSIGSVKAKLLLL